MPYIVVGPRGPEERPHEHEDRESALMEARRLAKANEDEAFTVYASLTTVRLKRFEEIDACPRDLHIDDVPF